MNPKWETPPKTAISYALYQAWLIVWDECATSHREAPDVPDCPPARRKKPIAHSWKE